MLIFIIIVVLVLILFIPIPLKFNFYASKDSYYIKFYNIILLSNDDGVIRKILNKNKQKTNQKNDSLKQKKTVNNSNNENTTLNNKKKKKSISFKKLYVNLKNNKFKPSLKLISNTSYSFGDASRTAIALGLLYNINPILFFVFSILLKVKLFKSDFKPIFKDKVLFEIALSSIITFNLAQIIYILFIISKSTYKK